MSLFSFSGSCDQLNAAGQKYYLVAMLVEVTTVEQLIDRLKKGKYKSSDEVLTKSE